jgi:hypothetical protein
VGILSQKTNLKVANLGSGSYSPLLYYIRLKELLADDFKFDHIIVFVDISDIHKVPRLAKDLKIENLDIENFKDKLNFENPKKIFFSVCKKANVNCFYLPLDKYSFYELDDEHWNDHGQQIAKDYLIKQLNLRR